MDFQLISKLADQGMLFVGTHWGKSAPLLDGWPNLATSDKVQIREWIGQGMNLCTVARHGHTAIAEIDDLAKAKALSMPDPVVGPTLRVWSASDRGGHNKNHIHAHSTAALEAQGTDYIYVPVML